MKGAVAAGHPLTAQAGARVLEAGGNAVDAAVAAALVSWVAESPLTGPGSGGFMLVHRARDRSNRVFDFFVAVPGLGLPNRELADMDRVDVDFSGGSSQIFHIGAASCAVPGAPIGLEDAHRSFGSLPWRELFQPAIDLARNGVELNNGQAYLHGILDLILRHTPESRAVYEQDGERLVADDTLVQTDLAGTLELLAEEGGKVLFEGELAQKISEHVRAHGGCITQEDLERYRVIRRRPVTASFCGEEYVSNPPPSAGGILIAYGLPLLEEIGPGSPGTAEAMDALARVMREQAHARIAARTVTGGLVHALEERAAIVSQGTTHISVIDGKGNAVGLTASTGAGSGVVVPGTGIHLNNMIGEFDLSKTPRPGARLASMMSPSIVLRDGEPHLVVGSAGSLRLRGAVMQIVVNAVAHDLPVEEALDRPRVHLEGDDLHCEGGHDPAELDRLEEMGWKVTRWRRRNLYFGGASAVTLVDGNVAAAGDPRRGGAGVVVE
ncbi:MAG: gamma-glutamyltransferase [Actinobacteria bacterium]|nr:MAG: gamma-glutamyltransferase [Actinomycetota bacterium]